MEGAGEVGSSIPNFQVKRIRGGEKENDGNFKALQVSSLNFFICELWERASFVPGGVTISESWRIRIIFTHPESPVSNGGRRGGG